MNYFSVREGTNICIAHQHLAFSHPVTPTHGANLLSLTNRTMLNEPISVVMRETHFFSKYEFQCCVCSNKGNLILIIKQVCLKEWCCLKE